MIDIINVCLCIGKHDQMLDNRDNVFLGEHFGVGRSFKVKFFIDPVTANISQVITFIREEKLVDYTTGSFFIRRLSIS